MGNPILDIALEDFFDSYSLFHEKGIDDGKGRILEGGYVLDAEWDGIRLVEEFELEITVGADYPSSIPTVKEKTSHIPASYPHIYCDRSFCLGVCGELALALQKNPSLVDFLNGPVRSYLYTALFYDRYGRYPFGDRSHGWTGILEYYRELFRTEDSLAAFRLMEYASTMRYRGHLDCPCGSGGRIRNCHGDQLRLLMDGSVHKEVGKDVERIRQGISGDINNDRFLENAIRKNMRF